VSQKHVITGAFGYSGSYIAARLLDQGVEVHTLTNSAGRSHRLRDRMTASPLAFDDSEVLRKGLEGADVLYNTYWVRFNHKGFSHTEAVEGTLRLFDAARAAGVGRVVHISITNPSEESRLEYFSGKARLERALKESGLAYTILRPAVLFGGQDILVNNIAWMLRRLPVFGVFGDGSYRLQPIHVDDLAELAIEEAGRTENRVVDAIGPETFSFRELATRIGEIIGCARPVVSVPPALGYAVARTLGLLLRDVVLTRDEIDGLMQGLLCTDSPPAGRTALTDWARDHADVLGRRYASELARRRDREHSYDQL
jgi:NADH dehydrogenase